jgi:hypothetical protein
MPEESASGTDRDGTYRGYIERPDPEDDPWRCSICGEPLGTLKRVEKEEHCEGCLPEYGVNDA